MPNDVADICFLSDDTMMDIHDDIMKLLEKKNCTVREAQRILTMVQKTINGTAPVQFVGRLPYEF